MLQTPSIIQDRVLGIPTWGIHNFGCNNFRTVNSNFRIGLLTNQSHSELFFLLQLDFMFMYETQKKG